MTNFKFESLAQLKRGVIIDTDIGPDCDDVGALAVLYALANKYDFDILGIINCTSNKYGSGCIDAINNFCKYPNVKIGAYEKEGFLDSNEHKKYNKFISENFSQNFINDTLKVHGATKLYRELLSTADDNSIIIVSIGPLNTVSELLNSQPDDISPFCGIDLISKKVNSLVSMAGLFPKGREYNVICDVLASQNVFENFPKPIIFSGFEVGANVMTGFEFPFDSVMQDNPIFKSYELYGDGIPTRNSWDLTAVHFAVEGEGKHYILSNPGNCTVNADGENEFLPLSHGSHYILIKNTTDNIISDYINELIRSFH